MNIPNELLEQEKQIQHLTRELSELRDRSAQAYVEARKEREKTRKLIAETAQEIEYEMKRVLDEVDPKVDAIMKKIEGVSVENFVSLAALIEKLNFLNKIA